MNHRDVFTTETEGLPEASNPSVVRLYNGDSFDLSIYPVRKRIGDAEVRMLGYNGSIPGPTLHVDQGSEITVQVTNNGDVEATVHWHGLRLENRYDGVPQETQAPIQRGKTFTYRIQFQDSTGTTRTSGKTSPRRWACTPRSWSNHPTPPTGQPSTGS
jgi:FtsP/CotA-like multicopper oxidase with cupredoxin domain